DQAAYELAQVFAGSSREDLMEWLYRTCLRYNPDHMWANNNLGYRLLNQDRDVPEAVRMIERAYAVMSANPQANDGDVASVTDSLGWARYKVGALDDEVDADNKVVKQGALSLLSRALTVCIRSPILRDVVPVISEHYADALWVSGQHEK